MGESYEDELQLAMYLARQAGKAALKYYDRPLMVDQKPSAGGFEPITAADREANELIVQGVRKEFPNDGILAEESIDTEQRLSRRRVWMVDPLDGTTGFIAHDDDFAVQIGLAQYGEGVLGVVYLPVPDVMYSATKGAGTSIQRAGGSPQVATVSSDDDIPGMYMAASRAHRSPRMNRVLEALGVTKEVRKGSVGVKVGLIVERVCSLYIHLSPRTKQWDTCAPEVILREAGGCLTDLFGKPLLYNALDVQNRNGIVATNKLVHDEIIALLAPLMAEFGREPAAVP